MAVATQSFSQIDQTFCFFAWCIISSTFWNVKTHFFFVFHISVPKQLCSQSVFFLGHSRCSPAGMDDVFWFWMFEENSYQACRNLQLSFRSFGFFFLCLNIRGYTLAGLELSWSARPYLQMCLSFFFLISYPYFRRSCEKPFMFSKSKLFCAQLIGNKKKNDCMKVRSTRNISFISLNWMDKMNGKLRNIWKKMTFLSGTRLVRDGTLNFW